MRAPDGHDRDFLGGRPWHVDADSGGDGVPGGPGSTRLGGAVFSLGSANAPATANVSDCTFVENQAVGGACGGGATFGALGAIANFARFGNANLVVSDDTPPIIRARGRICLKLSAMSKRSYCPHCR
jgi:hypothetical protein